MFSHSKVPKTHCDILMNFMRILGGSKKHHPLPPPQRRPRRGEQAVLLRARARRASRGACAGHARRAVGLAEASWASTGGLGKPLGLRSVGVAARSTATACVEVPAGPNGPFVWRASRVGTRGEDAFSGLGRRCGRVAARGAVGKGGAMAR